MIASCGAIGGLEGDGPPLLSAWLSSVTIRGIAVGSRAHAEEMNKSITANKLRPILDKSFLLKDLKEACKYVEGQKHIGKVVLDCQ